MDCHKADAAEQATWRSSGERPTCPQWHLLGLAIWSTLARSAGGVWPIHHLLQPVRPLAAGWCLGPHHRRTCAATHDAAVRTRALHIAEARGFRALLACAQGVSLGDVRPAATMIQAG